MNFYLYFINTMGCVYSYFFGITRKRLVKNLKTLNEEMKKLNDQITTVQGEVSEADTEMQRFLEKLGKPVYEMTKVENSAFQIKHTKLTSATDRLERLTQLYMTKQETIDTITAKHAMREYGESKDSKSLLSNIRSDEADSKAEVEQSATDLMGSRNNIDENLQTKASAVSLKNYITADTLRYYESMRTSNTSNVSKEPSTRSKQKAYAHVG